MIHEFRTPFPVETPLGQGYALYVMPANMWENDSWCVVLDDGRILHFTTNQLRYVGNGSYDMKKPRPLQVADPPLTVPAAYKGKPEDLTPGDVLEPRVSTCYQHAADARGTEFICRRPLGHDGAHQPR